MSIGTCRMPWRATITRRSRNPRFCTSRSASANRNSGRPNRFPGAALQARPERAERAQPRLGDVSVRVGAYLFKMRDGILVTALSQHAGQADLLVLGAGFERLVKRSPHAFVARQFRQIGQG